MDNFEEFRNPSKAKREKRLKQKSKDFKYRENSFPHQKAKDRKEY